MELFGMEKLSLVDYDSNIVATVFTGNCNFRCPFCHNGPLVNSVSTLKPLPESEVLEYVENRKKMLDGVCISGGEPTLQKDLPLFCEKIKKLGLKVKLDTNGTNPETVKLLHRQGLVDYFAVDIKNCLDKYEQIVAIKNFNTIKVEKTVEFLINECKNYEFRTTIIKEFHTKDDMKKIGEWIQNAEKYFLQKFKPSDTCLVSGLTEIDEKTAIEYLEIVSPFVKNAKLRGY